MFSGNSNGGGASAKDDPVADIRAVLDAALVTSSAIGTAEAAVSAIRVELETANRTHIAAIHERHAAGDRRHTGHDAGIRETQAQVQEIEARLSEAVATMAAAREGYAPRFAKVIAPLRKKAGEAILEAVDDIMRAVTILGEVEKFAARHGLPVGRVAYLLPRPSDLHQLAERLCKQDEKNDVSRD